MRKALLISFSLATLGVVATAQLAAAGNNCRQVCDQWGPDDLGHRRCFSSHIVCGPMLYHSSGPTLVLPAVKLSSPR